MKKLYFILFVALPVIFVSYDTLYQQYDHHRRMRKIYNTAGFIAYRLAQEEAKLEKQKKKALAGNQWP